MAISFDSIMPSSAGMSMAITIGIVALIVGGLGILIFLFVYNKVKFIYTIKLFQKIGNQVIPTATDMAKKDRISTSGDFWLICKKAKKILPIPTIQMGKRVYWFFEREDGEWINFALKDFDKEMKEAGIYYVHEDMRLQRLGIQKNLKNRFDKLKFWDKYGNAILSILYIMIIAVCLIVLFQKISGLFEQLTQTSTAIENMARAVENMGRKVGGGVKPI